MIMASLENGIGSIGGFVAGTSFVVEHQTLAGLGKYLKSPSTIHRYNIIPTI